MRGRRKNVWFIVLALAIVLLFCADLMLGSTTLSIGEVFRALFSEADQSSNLIIRKFRLPKAIVAVIVGASLSASGLQMQTLFRNPLAGPYILGVSSGASLGVALFLMGLPVLGMGLMGDILRNIGIVGAAWIGAAAVLLLIMAVSARIKDIMTVLVLGVLFGSAATALVDILQYMSPEGVLKSFVVWTMGSLGGVEGSQLAIMLPVCVVGLLLSVVLIKPLNVLLLGESYAQSMGVRISAIRGVMFLSTTLLAGTVTAFCGPIGFVGIVAPHVARMLFMEADHRVLMPGSIMVGVVMMLLCDIISQFPGSELTLPINTITALLGVPIIVMVIIRNRKFF